MRKATLSALREIKHPPKLLITGLQKLSVGKPVEEMPRLYELYGRFREALGVLYALTIYDGNFDRQRKSGKHHKHHLRVYAATFIKAAMIKHKLPISGGRVKFLYHVIKVVKGKGEVPHVTLPL